MLIHTSNCFTLCSMNLVKTFKTNMRYATCWHPHMHTSMTINQEERPDVFRVTPFNLLSSAGINIAPSRCFLMCCHKTLFFNDYSMSWCNRSQLHIWQGLSMRDLTAAGKREGEGMGWNVSVLNVSIAGHMVWLDWICAYIMRTSLYEYMHFGNELRFLGNMMTCNTFFARQVLPARTSLTISLLQNALIWSLTIGLNWIQLKIENNIRIFAWQPSTRLNVINIWYIYLIFDPRYVCVVWVKIHLPLMRTVTANSCPQK